MTDARYPERWLTDRRILRLSDAQHRTFVVVNTWAVSNRTDGIIEADDLALIVGCDTSDLTIAALVAHRLWEPLTDGTGWQVVDFVAVQTTRDELQVLDNARRRDREKKARQRQSKKAPTPDVPGDDPGDLSPGNDRPGKARQGQAAVTEPTTGQGAGDTSITAWPPVRAVGGVK